MKNFLFFLAGMIVGAGILYIVLSAKATPGLGIEYLEKPGKCITTESLEVLQVIDGGAITIARGAELFGTAVFILAENGEHFYDRQEIVVPKGACARHIGTYKYLNTEGHLKTIPLVRIIGGERK